MPQSESTKRRARHRALGLCTECSEKAMDGYAMCEKHHARRMAYEKLRYHKIVPEKRAMGMCVYNGCKCESIPGMSYCGYHQEMTTEKQAKFQAKNVARGRCRCGRPRMKGLNQYGKPYAMCKMCHSSKKSYGDAMGEVKRAMRLDRINNGLCVWCCKPTDGSLNPKGVAYIRCPECRAKKSGKRAVVKIKVVKKDWLSYLMSRPVCIA